MKHWIPCSCGGGADCVVSDRDRTGVAECACGRMLFWKEPDRDRPSPTLSFGVSDQSAIDETLS